jgi:hypothetical protein
MLRLLALLALSSCTFATLFTTMPDATTSWAAGQVQTIQWQESTDGAHPNLTQMGLCKISVYVGSVTEQVLVQPISTNTNVSANHSITFTPNPTIGPSGPLYFIRFESLTEPDPTNAAIPALAFSAKFTLTGMTGPPFTNLPTGTSGLGPGPSSTSTVVITTSNPSTATHSSTATAAAAKKGAATASAVVRSSSLVVAGAAALFGVLLF